MSMKRGAQARHADARCVRNLLSQMDVPTRSSCVMAIVTPVERRAAASITLVPRSPDAAVSPVLAGWMLGAASFGWPPLVAGGVKIAYDLLLLAAFRKLRPPEEDGCSGRNAEPRVVIDVPGTNGPERPSLLDCGPLTRAGRLFRPGLRPRDAAREA